MFCIYCCSYILKQFLSFVLVFTQSLDNFFQGMYLYEVLRIFPKRFDYPQLPELSDSSEKIFQCYNDEPILFPTIITVKFPDKTLVWGKYPARTAQLLPFQHPLEKHNLAKSPPLEASSKKGIKEKSQTPSKPASTRFNKISFLRGAFD